jgi:hypothetical protein
MTEDDYPFEVCPLCGAELGDCEGDHDKERMTWATGPA